MNIHHDTETISIRWHGLRKYKGQDIVGMRGFVISDFNMGQRYELSHENGVWDCWCCLGVPDDDLSSDPIYKQIKKDADLFAFNR